MTRHLAPHVFSSGPTIASTLKLRYYAKRMALPYGFVNAGGYSAESIQFFDRLATQPATDRKAAYNAMINALVSSGVWAKLDALYLFAAADSSTALTNLIGSSYTATKHASATFTADRGISGVAANYGVDSGFNPTSASSPKYVQNSASVFAWSGNYAPQTIALFGCGTPATGFDKLELYPRYTTGLRYQQINVESEQNGTAGSDGSGLSALNRAASGSWIHYQNGIVQSTQSIASSGLPASTIKFIGPSYSGNVTMAGFGQSLSANEHASLYSIVKTYLDAVGAPTTTATADHIVNVPGISKTATDFVADGHEATIGANPSGDMIVIAFPSGNSPPIFKVYSYPSGALLATKTWTDGGIYGSWMVVGGVIHMFGVQSDNHTIIHSTLDSSYNPSTVDTIYTAVATIANLCIEADSGGWVLSVEQITGPNSVKVLRTTSPSLATGWAAFGSDFTPATEGENPWGAYLGSPKIKYISGVYYIPYLALVNGTYQMVIAKSSDNCATFDIYTGSLRVIYPSVIEQRNASDWTAHELNGTLHAVYMDGNQAGDQSNRVCTYPYTWAQFVALFFP